MMRSVARRADSGAALAWSCLAIGGPVGGGPFGAGLVAEGGDGGFYGGEEVARVDGAGEPVAFDLASYRVLELGEYQADAISVQRFVEFFQHVGCGGVHVRHRLSRDHDPRGLRLRLGQPPDLVAERLGVGEE